jgi:hypothetical protein
MLATALCLLVAVASPATSFIPARSTIVLISGLPGDVESESAYNEHLQSWLEILADNGGLEKVVVLCDSPDTVTIPTSSATTSCLARSAFAATRARGAAAT